MENNLTVSNKDEIEVLDSSLLIKLKEPYKFEGKEYTQIVLKELNNITTETLIKAQRMMEQRGYNATVPEITTIFTCFLSSLVCNLPVEFFLNLPAREGMKLRGRVTSFLFGEA